MDQTEIRLFGPLLVRRADGSVVEQTEWRTSKNLELLRLLAVDAGQPISIGSILETLWPEVDEEHGRASLRTAASHIRKVLRRDCLERRPGSLVLHDVWVDIQSYSSLLVEVDHARRAGEHAMTVALVREAEAVYVGDIEVAESSGRWLDEVREIWRARRCEALVDAAEAAAAVSWMRDSLDFAKPAFVLDPHSEQAARALMRALAGLGEMDRALTVYERIRRTLADNFGVDPSPQTRALHMQLLTGTVDRSGGGGLVGHEKSVDAMVSAVAGLRRSGQGSGVLWLCGEPGSGRDSVVETACERLGLTLRNMNRDSTWMPEHPLAGEHPFAVPSADVVVMPRTESVSGHALGLLSALARRQRLVLVVPLQRHLWSTDVLVGLDEGIATEVVEVPALSEEDLLALARSVLQGEPTASLIRALRVESGSLAGLACSVARRWLGEGRIVWTPEGLDVRGQEESLGEPMSGAVRRSLRRLSPGAIDVLAVVAVADTDLTEHDIEAVTNALHPEQYLHIPDLLDSLIDGGLLRLSPLGFQLRDRSSRREVIDWLRPSARRRVHCLVAELLHLDAVTRTKHWVDGGMHQQACDFGVEAMMEAYDVRDLVTTQRLVDVLHQLPPSMRPISSEQPLGTCIAIMETHLDNDGRADLHVAGSRATATTGEWIAQKRKKSWGVSEAWTALVSLQVPDLVASMPVF
jgi:DNA-binding SARP family transcriptional activator